ncbi:MAG: methionine adenosyltransferase [Candidatus Magnetoovum sp. WYHC-5]|nr:methionine adenosyltransferase [Candidatus Magnetoovum sp. WYHC-5]
MKKDFILTSESVTEGHPDKLCDQISDAIVDRFLEQDPYSSVVAECAVSTAIVFIAAMFESDAHIDFTTTARQIINDVGYNYREFSGKTCSIITSLRETDSSGYRFFKEHEMSDSDIEKIPVKHQVTVVGYACNQTTSFMPLPIVLAHRLAKKLQEVRVNGLLPYLALDGKTQVGIEYKSKIPYRIHSLTVLASQNRTNEPSIEKLRADIYSAVIEGVFLHEPIKPDKNTLIYINPEGPLIVGGPSAHSGLTGRKTAMDTYGGYARSGGAALSGKCPLRIDRVGAYSARYAAKNVVASGLADECEVYLSYSIGLSRPVSLQVETYGTGKIPDINIAMLIEKHFDLRIAGIIKTFDLRNLPGRSKDGFYRKLASYGHMGRIDFTVPWEKIDKAEILRKEGLV